MPQIAVHARIRVNEGRGNELIAAFQPLFDQVEKEPGTLMYAMNRSKDDPDVFWVSELYADDDAFASHTGSDAMAASGPALGPIIAEAELIMGEPVLASGLPADKSADHAT